MPSHMQCELCEGHEDAIWEVDLLPLGESEADHGVAVGKKCVVKLMKQLREGRAAMKPVEGTWKALVSISEMRVC